MDKPQGRLGNQKGIALLMALFFVLIMSFLAMSISEETIVEYNVSAQSVNRLRAYYAAKAGVEISLLRIKIFKQAISSFGSQLKGNTHMLDPIWSFPLAWPPSSFIPEGTLTLANKIQLKDIEKESMMDAQYMTTISAEDSKLDLNDIGSASEGLRKSVREQLMQIFRHALEQEDSEKKYGDLDEYDAEKIVNNIQDWVDEDKESLNGGDESTYYKDTENSDFIPPNQAFKTVSELHMVEGMTDAIYDLIAPRITVYGIKGINVNYAEQNVLRSLDPQMTDEVVREILTRRNDPDLGPFSDEKDFINFIGQFISDPDKFNVSEIPLVFDAVYNFRIVSTGSFGRVQREITAITYDTESVKERYAKILDDEDKKKEEGQTDGSNQSDPKKGNNGDPKPGDPPKAQANSKKNKVPAGRPNIVYWTEN